VDLVRGEVAAAIQAMQGKVDAQARELAATKNEVHMLTQAQALALQAQQQAQQQTKQQVKEAEERLVVAMTRERHAEEVQHARALTDLKAEVDRGKEEQWRASAQAIEALAAQVRAARAETDAAREESRRLVLVQNDMVHLVQAVHAHAGHRAMQQDLNETQRQCDTLGRAILAIADTLHLQLPFTSTQELRFGQPTSSPSSPSHGQRMDAAHHQLDMMVQAATAYHSNAGGKTYS